MTRIVRYDPFTQLRRAFFSDFPFTDVFENTESDSILRLDMYEEDNNVIVEADLPGIDPKDVDITVTSDSLTIKAKKEEETEEKGKEYTLRERRLGSYARTVNFPVQVVPDSAKAEFVDGTLKLTIEKEATTTPKSVKVEVKKK